MSSFKDSAPIINILSLSVSSAEQLLGNAAEGRQIAYSDLGKRDSEIFPVVPYFSLRPEYFSPF